MVIWFVQEMTELRWLVLSCVVVSIPRLVVMCVLC